MLASTALVLLMTPGPCLVFSLSSATRAHPCGRAAVRVPFVGLAFFYGGLVGSKNVLNTMMMYVNARGRGGPQGRDCGLTLRAPLQFPTRPQELRDDLRRHHSVDTFRL